jgi:hypothetical protein
VKKTYTGELKADVRIYPDGAHLYLENADGSFVGDVTFRVNPRDRINNQGLLLAALVQLFEKEDAKRDSLVHDHVKDTLNVNVNGVSNDAN